MLKSFLKFPVAMPGLLFITLTFLLVITTVIVHKHNDTVYLINKSADALIGENLVLIKNNNSPNEFKLKSKNNTKQTNKTFANIFTMLFWGFFGLFLYCTAYIFYMIFINPVGTDKRQSRYVHADKKYIIVKRLFWCLAIAFVTVTLIGIVAIYTRILVPYYQLSIYSFRITSVLMFFVCATLITIMIAGVRLGCRVIARTY